MKSNSANGVGGSVAPDSGVKFANGQNSYALHNGGEKIIVEKPPVKTRNGVTNPAKCPVPQQPVNGVKNSPTNDDESKNTTIKSDKRKIFTKGIVLTKCIF